MTEYDKEPSGGAGLSKSAAMENLSQEDLVELKKEDAGTAKNGVREREGGAGGRGREGGAGARRREGGAGARGIDGGRRRGFLEAGRRLKRTKKLASSLGKQKVLVR